jgi:pyrroline-5-carboxylate reductase
MSATATRIIDFLLRQTVNAADLRIGFIGAGQMATALARGFVQTKVVSPDRIVACDVIAESAQKFAAQTGGKVVAGATAVLADSNLVFLAVKPQQMATVLAELKPALTSNHLLVSIAAGISLAKMSAELNQFSRIIRVMPNTPALVGAGASAFARGATATPEDGQLVQSLLSTVGLALEVPEKLLDAVTGLSGSGPAYVYQFIEGLSDGGVRMGLPRDVATRLAAQTVLGAAQMVLTTGQHPGQLKDAVTSPGGTTIAGLHELELGGMRGILMNAVQSATERSKELGEA